MTLECQKYFVLIKEPLITASVLSCPDINRTFVPQTDASAYSLIEVLTEQFAGHVGISKIFWELAEQFNWLKLRVNVSRYLRNCEICPQKKIMHKPPAGLMSKRPEVCEHWQFICLRFRWSLASLETQ